MQRTCNMQGGAGWRLALAVVAALGWWGRGGAAEPPAPNTNTLAVVEAKRFPGNPIIRPGMPHLPGQSINGPSRC